MLSTIWSWLKAPPNGETDKDRDDNENDDDVTRENNDTELRQPDQNLVVSVQDDNVSDDDGSELSTDLDESSQSVASESIEERYLKLRTSQLESNNNQQKNRPFHPPQNAIDGERQRIKLEEEFDKQTDERTNMLPGQPCHVPNKFSAKIGYYAVPKRIFVSIQQNMCWPEDKLPITYRGYSVRMHRLLYMEEAKQQLEMRRYDIKGLLIGRYDSFLMIPVEGLAEGRPSLLRGDKVTLRSGANMMYEAYIHEVREEDILVKTHTSCHPNDFDGVKFDIQFYSSRTPFRRCHHAVHVAPSSMSADTLFPSTKSKSCTKKSPAINVSSDGHKLKLFNSDLNEQQRKAVVNILHGYSRPAPYLVFGPPGTGKTVSLVEAILQVFKLRPTARILVCCNSNSGTDLLATRLLDSGAVDETNLLRLSAFYRLEKLIPDHLTHVTFGVDQLDDQYWLKYRIIVTTCIQSGCLYDHIRPGVGLFDYVFIDEAGHANEPETMVPMTLMLRQGLAVLAGDPFQLGPVCISKIADECGLGESLLERLSRLAPYQRDLTMIDSGYYNPKFITKLLVNYRSDARVMTLNNKMFYDNELIYRIKSPTRCLSAINTRYPLLFHAINGRDSRDYTNPSWFNPNEAIVIMTYISRLYDAGFTSDQIGIVTPYRRQIDKVRSLFVSASLDECKIATMEEFQGDEREIIIISTVRSRQRNIGHDNRFHLGFLFNPKRFNVAISRAKWLVIVIGNPDILTLDPCWSDYIELCKQNNTYIEEKQFTGVGKDQVDGDGKV